MKVPVRSLFFFGFFICGIPAIFAYGPLGHEIVGAVADRKLAGTETAAKISGLLEGITLARAANLPDEIKAWDKSGADDLTAWPHYPNQPKLEQQLRDFWKANPPGPTANDQTPSHHWMHYTDVPVLDPEKYGDGKTGRENWDIVHAIPYCIGVLRGEIPEDNPRKITKPVAIILLAHYVGDIHQPLHVGAEYFNESGQPVDPDKGAAGMADEGGNSLSLVMNADGAHPRHYYHSFHGYWDMDTVRNFVLGTPDEVPKENRQAIYAPAKEKAIASFAGTEPKNWRTSGDPKTWAQQWANEILSIAREAHTRLAFEHIHRQEKDGRIFAKGEAKETGTGYLDWSTKAVGDELHKAGWRLADLLKQCLVETKASTAAEAAQPAPPKANETSTAPEAVAASPVPSPSPSQDNPFGPYPDDYKKVVTDWLRARNYNSMAVQWQSAPKPAALPDARGHETRGFLVIVSLPDRHGKVKSHGLIIRDHKLALAVGFD